MLHEKALKQPLGQVREPSEDEDVDFADPADEEAKPAEVNGEKGNSEP